MTNDETAVSDEQQSPPRRFHEPMHDDEDIERWRHATMEEKGQALYSLLRLVDAMGQFPPKTTQFPGWKRILAERKGGSDV